MPCDEGSTLLVFIQMREIIGSQEVEISQKELQFFFISYEMQDQATSGYYLQCSCPLSDGGTVILFWSLEYEQHRLIPFSAGHRKQGLYWNCANITRPRTKKGAFGTLLLLSSVKKIVLINILTFYRERDSKWQICLFVNIFVPSTENTVNKRALTELIS